MTDYKYNHKTKHPLPVLDNKQLTPEEYMRLRYGTSWHSYVSEEEARKFHRANVEACQKAVETHLRDKENGGPLKILVVHGSSRSSEKSCAHELSNSQMLARIGIQPYLDNEDVIIEEVNLRNYNIEACNSCYSTTSALCGFPCDCFPIDPMQKLYPKVLWCDILLCSTGVNQSAMASRLKLFCDRLISLDGGYYRTPEQFQYKGAEFREKMIAVSTQQPVIYDPRMYGRVAAFFLSSKDEMDDEELHIQSYVRIVADSLRQGFEDFGMQFADGEEWYASAGGRPDEDLSYDKARILENKEAHAYARKVVFKAIELARELRDSPPVPDTHIRNRT